MLISRKISMLFLVGTILVSGSALAQVDLDTGSSQEPAALKNVSVMDSLKTEDLIRSVAALKVEEVAWRKIDWETCLLRGLARSKTEQKPVLLWVFIDRPIDDERC